MRELVPLSLVDPAEVDALLDAAFGADRHARTAYRLREGVSAIPRLSLAALDDDTLVGSIQCWPVELRGDDGEDTPMILVGPIAVSPAHQDVGIGRALTRKVIADAPLLGSQGGEALMLIGDADYYGRFFGFAADRTREWRLPGPFERDRLLALGDAVPARAGLVAPRKSVTD